MKNKKLIELLTDGEEIFNNLWLKLNEIKGYLTYSEGYVLYNLASKMSNQGDILELGSYQGKSTVLLGKALESSKISKLITVDNFSKTKSNLFNNFENPKTALLTNLKLFNLEKIVQVHESDSVDFLKNDRNIYSMIFIDTLHTKEQIMKEYPFAIERLNEGGILIIHDYLNESVDLEYSSWIRENILSKHESLYIRDSSINYGGNGLLIVQNEFK